jgi:hypothetical protein
MTTTILEMCFLAISIKTSALTCEKLYYLTLDCFLWLGMRFIIIDKLYDTKMFERGLLFILDVVFIVLIYYYNSYLICVYNYLLIKIGW